MTIATEQQETPGTDKLAALQQRLSAEMQRHAEAVAAIRREMQDATRAEARSLIESEREATTEVPESREPASEQKRELTADQKKKLLAALELRLRSNIDHYTRPEGINFEEVKRALEANPAAMWSLAKMEETGGSPDVVAVKADAFIFADCSAESPTGRRNCVYDEEAEEHIIVGFNSNAVQMAKRFGVDLWSEDFYRKRQMIGEFDVHSWNWLQAPDEIRKSGHALLGCRHDDDDDDGVSVERAHVAFHRGDGGWRGLLRVQKVS